MSERFFVETPIVDNRTLVEGVEAHHLIHVMRLKVGQPVTLFDGSGLEFQGQIGRIGRTEAEVEILSRAEVNRELRVPIVLGVSLPKGDRQKWLIEKAVELGVTRIIPLRTERSVAQPVTQAIDRLQRSVIEASKQCGRNRLMVLSEPQRWQDFVSDSPPEACCLIAHPESPCEHGPAQANKLHNGMFRHPIVIAVGPEGGFTADEVQAARKAGWQTRDLGPRILRIETAALLMVAIALQITEAH